MGWDIIWCWGFVLDSDDLGVVDGVFVRCIYFAV